MKVYSQLVLDPSAWIRLRNEQVATLPAWGASDEGRVLYAQDENKYYMGTNVGWIGIQPSLDIGGDSGLNLGGDDELTVNVDDDTIEIHDGDLTVKDDSITGDHIDTTVISAVLGAGYIRTQIVIVIPGALSVGDDQGMILTPDETITLTEVRGYVKTTGLSLDVDVRTVADSSARTSATTLFSDGDLQFTTLDRAIKTSFAKATIAQNEWIVVDVNTVTGTPADLTLLFRGKRLLNVS